MIMNGIEDWQIINAVDAQRFRQQDLLNTLLYTLAELRREGVEVKTTRNEGGWATFQVEAFHCPKCGRMTARSEGCRWCDLTLQPPLRFGEGEQERQE